ncbi:HD-GYP domain-containing protein [Oceanobacillus salinisoli]|uniref:HD-GYP domain-containing protein n=1 Tax=Oceanobacillus salinisoli TaxID=2678611 RepID=UPI0012E2D437|nr:HD-GYP domain-containing protein [Oceanobacillus salinisoli]
MQVMPSQLVPGCILLKDVWGKTNHPIIPKNTVLLDIHIEILKAFLVDTVEVSTQLNNGELFEPESVDAASEEEQITGNQWDTDKTKSPFQNHYEEAVKGYKELFKSWQSGMSLDILHVRKLIIPLLERTEDIDEAVTLLHQYGKKEEYLYYHSVAVAILSSYLARKLGYSKGEWLQIGIAGLLSDSGMSRIDPKIVFKKGSLQQHELEEIKKHPTLSYRLVEQTSSLTAGVKLAIIQHHERFDGSGYPLGVPMDKIHKYAQIVGICDSYHAMTSERLYKAKQSPFKVIEELQKSEFTKFDSAIVHKFVSSIADFPIGTKVRLTNDQTGEIIFIEPSKPTRPIVKLDGTGEIISLQNMPNVHLEARV